MLESAAAAHDLILTSGGVSTGEADYVKAAVESVGTLVFWRMAIKPGRPVAMGVIDGTPVHRPAGQSGGELRHLRLRRPPGDPGALPARRLQMPPAVQVRAAFTYQEEGGPPRICPRQSAQGRRRGARGGEVSPRGRGAAVLAGRNRRPGRAARETSAASSPARALPSWPIRAWSDGLCDVGRGRMKVQERAPPRSRPQGPPARRQRPGRSPRAAGHPPAPPRPADRVPAPDPGQVSLPLGAPSAGAGRGDAAVAGRGLRGRLVLRPFRRGEGRRARAGAAHHPGLRFDQLHAGGRGEAVRPSLAGSVDPAAIRVMRAPCVGRCAGAPAARIGDREVDHATARGPAGDGARRRHQGRGAGLHRARRLSRRRAATSSCRRCATARSPPKR